MDSRVVSRVTRYSGIPQGDCGFRLRVSHPLWSGFPSASPNVRQSHIGLLQPRWQCHRFGLFRVRSPLLAESIVFFIFLRLLRCFTSPGLATLSLSSLAGFRKERCDIIHIRLPHSEISGSTRICRSPKLIAAYHVLHRLLAPRHSLCALYNLISPALLKPAKPILNVRRNSPRYHFPRVLMSQSAPQGGC